VPIAHTGSYAMTAFLKFSIPEKSITALSCFATTSNIVPPSLSSSNSPIARAGMISASMAYMVVVLNLKTQLLYLQCQILMVR
jgi:hypothetical protein